MKHQHIYSKRNQQSVAFTIAELIVVIVVISLLTLMTVVWFGSWRSQAAETEVKSSIHGVQAGMKNVRNLTNQYPTFAVGTEFSGTNATKDIFIQSKTVKIVYRKGSSTGYCIDAQSVSEPNIRMYVNVASGTEKIESGLCT